MSVGVRFLILLLLAVSSPVRAAQIDVVGVGARQALLIRGPIIEGDDQRFEAALAQSSSPLIVLASPGGRVLPALAIGRRIRANALTTAVGADTDCASACALIWLAGETRRLATTGRIGLHAMSIMPSGGPGIDTHTLDGMLRNYLTGLGCSLDTTATIVNTPAASVRWMDATELSAAGIAAISYR